MGKTFDVVVIGAGFAGAATAYSLVRAGCGNVVVLEREAQPGLHASGRSAGLVRRATEDPELAPLAREGADEIVQIGVPFRRSGSILIGAESEIPSEVRANRAHRKISGRSVTERVPLLDGAEVGGAIETPDDGVVDTTAFLGGLLREVRRSGGVVRYGVEAQAPRGETRLEGVETSDGFVAAKACVVAQGAWAAEWGTHAGLGVRLTPYRRHLTVTSLPKGVTQAQAADWPWVWDLERKFYFRPHRVAPGQLGLLWCSCDHDEDSPGHCSARRSAPEQLAERIAKWLPAIREIEVLRYWAGHRTFAPDHRFLLGADPRCEGLHWAVALGGHGVTAALSAGRRVAESVLSGQSPEPAIAFRPAVDSSSIGDSAAEGASPR